MNMDVERLIEFVKQKPNLYDYRNPLYKNKAVKEKTWNEIAAQLGTSGYAARSRWRNLRDCYAKHLKGEAKAGQSFVKYKYWPWSHQMEFIKQYLSTGREKANLEVATSLKQQEEEEYPFVKEEVAENGEPEYEPIVFVDQNISPSSDDEANEEPSLTHMQECRTSLVRKRKALSSPEYELHSSQNRTENGLGATEHIFMGYAKIINTFSPKAQIEAKLKVATLMMQLELENLQEAQ